MIRFSLRAAMLAAVPLCMMSGAASAQRLAVFPIPETLFPNIDHPLSQEFTAGPGDVLLTARIMRTQTTVIDDPVTVTIDRFKDAIKAGDELTPVITPPETRNRLGAPRQIFCGDDQRSRSSFLNSMIGEIGSKFEAIVRFCFFDGDGDGKLDRAFLAGAKDKAMQVPVPIAPAGFHSTYFQQIDKGDEVRIRYRKFKPESRKIQLEVEVYRAGTKAAFDYLNYDPASGDKLDQQYPIAETNPKKLPYPMRFTDLLGAEIVVGGVTSAGEATFTVRRPIRRGMFRPVTIQVRYIYVYI